MNTQAQETSSTNQKKTLQGSETVVAEKRTMSNDSTKQPAVKKRKIKKGMTTEIIEKRKANMQTRFNSLPSKVKIQIFLEFDYYELGDLGQVCSHWSKFMDHLCVGESIDIPPERKSRFGRLPSLLYHKISFDMYRNRYPVKDMINTDTISIVSDGRYLTHMPRYADWQVEPIDHNWVFVLLQDLSRNICGSVDWEDVLWDFILRLTGEQYSIEDLKKEESFESELVKSIMSRHTWYWWTEEETTGRREYVGLVTLNTDGKTFAILHFPNIRREDDEDDDDDYFV